VPAADPLVDEHRRHLDAASCWGVPAHVSVLYPFVEPAQVEDDLIATLVTVLGQVAWPMARGKGTSAVFSC
jgi:hypothetical protein